MSNHYSVASRIHNLLRNPHKTAKMESGRQGGGCTKFGNFNVILTETLVFKISLGPHRESSQQDREET